MRVSGNRSVTNRARREQIVDAMVAVVAEEGFEAATFARLARRAGLPSTRTISYHFADKDDLVAAAVERLLGVVGTFVGKRVADHQDPPAALAAYIRTAVALNDTHRTEMRALLRIFLDHRPAGGRRPYDHADEDTALARVAAILADGQASGAFRPFDVEVMAATVQRSLDGLPFLLERVPDTDLARYADELVTLFDLATRATRATST